ncbi:uncharacterized protein BCR38DRAFT_413414 [Pseudomassariella vexata]|uniref:Uncharacterized protein n=1 Tax=Pseudomassariella vexata TaxID=1141098 RepID=A0A1Y2DID0_9PEZI|nr:uncharacterized protein BCR38DRAFT_413414 [Pseudomassariella vexata]ORY58565.1 hypothetical protein BCR38DRAFT_413414 [Pseudomassariella vexata]
MWQAQPQPPPPHADILLRLAFTGKRRLSHHPRTRGEYLACWKQRYSGPVHISASTCRRHCPSVYCASFVYSNSNARQNRLWYWRKMRMRLTFWSEAEEKHGSKRRAVVLAARGRRKKGAGLAVGLGTAERCYACLEEAGPDTVRMPSDAELAAVGTLVRQRHKAKCTCVAVDAVYLLHEKETT